MIVLAMIAISNWIMTAICWWGIGGMKCNSKNDMN